MICNKTISAFTIVVAIPIFSAPFVMGSNTNGMLEIGDEPSAAFLENATPKDIIKSPASKNAYLLIYSMTVCLLGRNLTPETSTAAVSAATASSSLSSFLKAS